MSRAIDKHLAAVLVEGNPHAAYRVISSILHPPLHSFPHDSESSSPDLVEIEILGKNVPLPDGTYMLREDQAVGVSKLGLVQAFLVARHVLKAHIGGSATLQEDDEGEASKWFKRPAEAELKDVEDVHEDEDVQKMRLEKVLAATAVTLLMDPEHLTAANTRKRILLTLFENHLTTQTRPKSPSPENDKTEDSKTPEATTTTSPSSSPSIALLTQLWKREKWFLDSLLTSRLNRHTKSPTLWSHRRWLVSEGSDGFLARCNKIRGHASPTTEVTDKSMLKLIVLPDLEKVVFVAGQRHPRNYYAWCHARFLVRNFILPPPPSDNKNKNEEERTGETTPTSGLAEEDVPVQLSWPSEKVLYDLKLATSSWCSRHHTDTSGWSFLFFLLIVQRAWLPRDYQYREMDFRHEFQSTLRSAESLRLANESVWVFLRTMAACLDDDTSPDTRPGFARVPHDKETLYAEYLSVARGLLQRISESEAATAKEKKHNNNNDKAKGENHHRQQPGEEEKEGGNGALGGDNQAHHLYRPGQRQDVRVLRSAVDWSDKYRSSNKGGCGAAEAANAIARGVHGVDRPRTAIVDFTQDKNKPWARWAPSRVTNVHLPSDVQVRQEHIRQEMLRKQFEDSMVDDPGSYYRPWADPRAKE